MALQLMEFRNTRINTGRYFSKIHIHTQNLEKVLNKCGDRPLCIICISGPSQQGKSFILNHMIRCLEATQNKDEDWMDWGNPGKALGKGFTWKKSHGPVTKGMWIWDKPFFVKSFDGKEFAVLLIDTQGTYDEFTSVREMTSIVGLSMLISSIMIFNLYANLQEDMLSSLGTYIEYGLLSLNGKHSEKPFQKLMFLIRDWNNPTEFSYGKKGGKMFIKKKLEVKQNQPDSARKVRETISKCFQEVSCFLLPAIGDRALAKDYDGNIGALNKTFAKKLEEFIRELTYDEIVVKRIVGTEITATEFRMYIDMYVKTFNSSNLPSATSMWEATTSVANIISLKKQNQDKMGKRGIGETSKMETEIKDRLQCPICFEIPLKEIYQCENGHTFCDECAKGIRNMCPQCRMSLGNKKIRNRALEALLDVMKFDCSFHVQGCTQKISRKEIGSHKETCKFG